MMKNSFKSLLLILILTSCKDSIKINNQINWSDSQNLGIFCHIKNDEIQVNDTLFNVINVKFPMWDKRDLNDSLSGFDILNGYMLIRNNNLYYGQSPSVPFCKILDFGNPIEYKGVLEQHFYYYTQNGEKREKQVQLKFICEFFFKSYPMNDYIYQISIKETGFFKFKEKLSFFLSKKYGFLGAFLAEKNDYRTYIRSHVGDIFPQIMNDSTIFIENFLSH
jgi:hypothetical protein